MKKYRGLRRRYKLIGRKLDDFVLYLDDDSWYSFFHIHLDWKGITDYSAKNRRSHIKWYLHFLDKIEILTKDKSKLFQTWIILDSGCYYKNEYYSYCIQKKGLGISLIRYEDGR